MRSVCFIWILRNSLLDIVVGLRTIYVQVYDLGRMLVAATGSSGTLLQIFQLANNFLLPSAITDMHSQIEQIEIIVYLKCSLLCHCVHPDSVSF